MNESILNDIKKCLGIAKDYTHFDQDIIIHINTFLEVLYQIGVGKKGFIITDSSSTWTDFLGSDSQRLPAVRTYVYLRVRLLFDPPSNSFVTDSLKKNADELEWRLNVEVDPGVEE